MKISVDNFDFDLQLVQDFGFFILYAKKLNSDKNIGMLSFLFKEKDRVAWLNKIEVEKKFQGKGVGYGLLKTFEYLASQRLYRNIEGKYYPTNERAKSFYLRNGYAIYREGYNQEIFKIMDRKKIEQEFNQINVSGEKLEVEEVQEK